MARALKGLWWSLAVVILLVGCGAGSHNPAAPVLPQSAGASLAGAAGESLLGDLDADGSASVGDAIKILRIVVGLDADSSAADANQNCGPDVGDAIKLLRLVVRLDSDWPLTWQKAWITGTVKEYIDEQTTSPLAGVEATVGGQSATTGSDGEFEIECVPLGDQTIAVAKDAYQSAGPLPASVLIEAPRTALAPVYMIMSGNAPPPRP